VALALANPDLFIQLLLARVRYNKSYGTRRVPSDLEVDDGSTDVEVPVASTGSGTAASVGVPLHRMMPLPVRRTAQAVTVVPSYRHDGLCCARYTLEECCAVEVLPVPVPLRAHL
jgi:hypothetical protein